MNTTQKQFSVPTLSVKANSYLLAFVCLAAISLGHAQTLPDLITYSFTAAETKTLPGSSATPGPPCNGAIAAADQIQNLALVALFYQNDCYTDGRYNHNNYLVERGTVAAAGGPGSFAAYRIHEPQNKATQFLASKHAIYYRFPTIENYSVYSFAGGSLSKVAEVPAAAIANTNNFIPVPTATPITVSEVIGSVTYVFAPSATRVSSYTSLAPGHRDDDLLDLRNGHDARVPEVLAHLRDDLGLVLLSQACHRTVSIASANSITSARCAFRSEPGARTEITSPPRGP